MRKWDRILDLHLHMQMQKVVGDKLRPDGAHDPHGVDQAKNMMITTLDLIEDHIAGKQWFMGEAFTMADCAAAPALFYADRIVPFRTTHTQTAAYLERLKARPSFARVLNEAEPYFKMFPG
jgi:glutathione S-transferase